MLRFQYGFTFDEEINEDDATMVKNGVTLLIDSMTAISILSALKSTTKEDFRRCSVRYQESERHHNLQLWISFSV